jgi:hypothetical protein
MKKRTLFVPVGMAVSAGLVVSAGVAGCSSATLPSVAEVTGFTSVPVGPAAGSPPSGPVTVRIAGKDASQLGGW